MNSILLVEDDKMLSEIYAELLGGYGYNITTSHSGEDAISILGRESFDLVISDLKMGPIDGFTVLNLARSQNPRPATILLTGVGNEEIARETLRQGIDDYIIKSKEVNFLKLRVSKVLEKLTLIRLIEIYERVLPRDLLTVCCHCYNINPRNGREDSWITLDKFLETITLKKPTFTYCPECLEKVEKFDENL